MVVTSSSGFRSPTGTEHGLNALPLMCDVQALHTSMPHPYFGPVMPSRSRRTHNSRTSSGASTVTRRPLTRNVCFGTAAPYRACFRPSRRDCGIGGCVGNGRNGSGSLWLIGKYDGVRPVAWASAHATALLVTATPNSPAPPGLSDVGGITMTFSFGGVFHCRV